MGEQAEKLPVDGFAPPMDARTLVEAVTIRNVEDIHDAAVVLRDYAAAYGLRVALCDDIASKETMVDADGAVLAADLFGWLGDGERWWEDHRLALHSPLPRSCRYESEPFWCNSEGFRTAQPNPYLEEIDPGRYFAANPRYKSAIVVPVHLPFGQISANSFHPGDPDIVDLTDLFAEIGDTLGLATRRFIAGYASAMRTKRRIPSDCELSKREVECLRWAAIGKTDREIGMIISLSHATVRYHVHRAGEKLNSVNRAQTIFKAGQLGYLGANS
ncbi:helix-turn-helix transcriptional regulator [Sphingopyxis sp. H050]|jgi:DNA-binding CsgD family transcriptional regulator|uniref:helix-turn-helix transcriptional regulator n=1 Tax=Sphingopyxis sp. H050 TaxID=1759072 RepID=UPI000A4248F5|nr:LuxR C-terminal-related transcriptional regulator [Sphingopyxis sp. H050]